MHLGMRRHVPAPDRRVAAHPLPGADEASRVSRELGEHIEMHLPRTPAPLELPSMTDAASSPSVSLLLESFGVTDASIATSLVGTVSPPQPHTGLVAMSVATNVE